jgi:uncharacterized membrane protein YgdD (TMEM256/DUF423 family)
MNTKIKIIALLGFLAVALGAFGAHGLRNVLDAKTMHAFETAVQYHFYHLFALAFLINMKDKMEEKKFNLIFKLFLIGIVLFSGSLYGISFAKSAGISLQWLGPITPVGGVFFMVAWAMLGYSFLKPITKN